MLAVPGGDAVSTAYDRLLDALNDDGRLVKETGNGKAMACCPAHDDRNPSLSVTRIDGSVLLYCHAGCHTDDVLAAVRLTKADLYDERNGATYDYGNGPPGGRRVRRSPEKDFWQTGNTKDTSLFHVERIGDSPLVFVCEGEKDVLAVETAGGVAVCSAQGASNPHLADWSPLHGRHVVLIAHKDKAGHDYAAKVKQLLHDIAASVSLVEAAIGNDAADHIAAGKGLGEFVAMTPREDTNGPEPVDDGERDTVRAFTFPDGQRPTDIGNAARLLRHADGRLRYVHAWGKWIVYQHGRWIIDEKDALVTEIAKQVPKGLFELAAKTAFTNPEDAKPIWPWALKSCASGTIAAMVRLARGAPGILVEHEQLDSDPWLLNVGNGTIDLRTGKLRDHDPADLCTLQAPVDYDEHATAPLWKSCLQRWQPDDTVLDYVQVRAGAGATGIPTETIDIDYGGGGNGKSKFHGAIQHVLGPYATVPHKSLLVAGRFEQHPTVIADLFRKRLALASETKQAEDLDDESVKNLTGGDRLKGRRMREDQWEFWPTHTLIMFPNHKPTVAGRDEGIWRRLRLVPWQVTIPENERDEQLATKLRAEAPGILNWIIDGAVRFHRDRLDPPPVVRYATNEYRAEEDVIGRFILEALDIDTTGGIRL